MELERKVNFIIEELSDYHCRQDIILSSINIIEKKINLIENELNRIESKSIDDNLRLFNNIQNSSIHMFSQINSLNKHMDMIKSEVISQSEKEDKEFSFKLQLILDEIMNVKNDLLNAQRENTTPLIEFNRQLRSVLLDTISENNQISTNQLKTLGNELETKYEGLYSLIRLLLLNNMMDQLEE